MQVAANQQRSTEPKVGKLRWYYKSPRIYWNLLCFFDHSNSWSISPVLLNFCILSQPSKSHKWFFTGSTVRCHSFSLYGRHEALHSGRSRWEPCESAPGVERGRFFSDLVRKLKYWAKMQLHIYHVPQGLMKLDAPTFWRAQQDANVQICKPRHPNSPPWLGSFHKIKESWSLDSQMDPKWLI